MCPSTPFAVTAAVGFAPDLSSAHLPAHSNIFDIIPGYILECLAAEAGHLGVRQHLGA